MKLVITAPVIDTAISLGDKYIIFLGNIIISRQIPYPPNFSRIAASTILPATGASTWALGNHK
jgi:hypothetical protein